MTRRLRAGAILGVFLAVALLHDVRVARAAEAAKTAVVETPASVDPEAAVLLKAALERIATAKSLSFAAEIASDTVLPSGQKIAFTGRIETAIRRPDRLRNSFDGEQRSTRSWYDGKTYTLLDVAQNVYACWPGPARLEDLLDTMKERLGFTPPLSLLLHEDVARAALSRMTRGFTVGPATIGGVAVQHLAFSGGKTDWQLWVTEGPEPTIKRIVITFKQQEGLPQFSASFLSWDFAPLLDDDLFAFVPPAGAMQCDFRLMRREGGP
jgi:hypothetical protein